MQQTGAVAAYEALLPFLDERSEVLAARREEILAAAEPARGNGNDRLGALIDRIEQAERPNKLKKALQVAIQELGRCLGQDGRRPNTADSPVTVPTN